MISIKNNIQNYNIIFPNATSFRGSNTPPLSLELPPDTVEISTKKKDDKLSLKKCVVALLGAAVAIAGGILLHKQLTKPTFEKCQQNLSKILRRDVSKEETQVMLNRYKELFKIENEEEFVDKLFKQVKKDYEYENLDISYCYIEKEEVERLRKAGIYTAGGCNIFPPLEKATKNKTIVICYDNKKEMFNAMMHEFQHLKQNEYAYRTSKEKFLEAARKMQDIEEGEFNAYKNYFEQIYSPVWDKLPKFEVGSKEYKLGMSYIENMENYAISRENEAKYRTQLMEREAYKVGNMARKIYDYITKNH